MFDRNRCINSIPPTFLAAAVCPVVMVPFPYEVWIGFGFVLAAILVGWGTRPPIFEVDFLSRVLLLMAGISAILLQASSPIVLAFLWCWLIGLGFTFWRKPVPWNHSLFTVAAVGLALTVVATA